MRRHLTLRVLQVEETPTQAELVHALVETTAAQDFEFVTCTTARTAGELLRREPFDCVLLDLNLPDATDLDALNTVRSADQRVAVVVVSRTTEPELVKRSRDRDVDAYLVKGTADGARIRDTIRAAVTRRRDALRVQDAWDAVRASGLSSTRSDDAAR